MILSACSEMRFWDHQTQHLPPPPSRKRFNKISDNQFDLLLEMQTNLSLRLHTVTKQPNCPIPNTHELQPPDAGKCLLQVQGRIYVELGVSTWVSYKKNPKYNCYEDGNYLSRPQKVDSVHFGCHDSNDGLNATAMACSLILLIMSSCQHFDESKTSGTETCLWAKKKVLLSIWCF